MFVQITKSNKNNFRGLVAEEILGRIGNEADLFGIGLTEAPDTLPLGVLVFENRIETDIEGEQRIISSILWLYVQEDARDYGIATGLFYEYLRALGVDENDVFPIPVVDYIRVDVPMDQSYNLLCGVFEDFGFTFSVEELPVLTVELKELYKVEKLSHSSRKDIVPLCSVPQKIFSEGLLSCAGEWDLGDINIPLDKTNYEQDASMVYVSGGKPRAFLLLKKRSDHLIDVVLLRETKGCPEDIKIHLIAKALADAKLIYLPDTTIRANCNTEEAATFVDSILPDIKPLLVRRGYLG